MGIATEQRRKRAITAYLKHQGTQAQIAALYGVNIRTFQDWLERYRKTGRTAPLPRGHRRAVFHGSSLDALDRLVQRHPDATLTEIKDLDCSIMAVQRALSRPGYRYKKTLHAAEQKREDVERLREQWLAELPHLDPGRLVFIDESGAKTNMTRLHGRARHGLRLLAHAPHGHGCTTTMISSIRLNGQTAAMEVEGPSDGAVFREYIRAVLAPTLCSPAISL